MGVGTLWVDKILYKFSERGVIVMCAANESLFLIIRQP